MSHTSEQKTIAKNTVFLYVRMIVVMAVSLYTSRVVLDKLGVNDFGIYNIVGSVVVSLTFVSNALTSAMRRYFSYEIGEKNGDCSKVFTMSYKIQLIIIAVLLVLLETLGLWFFGNVIKIPEGRETAAAIVYQFSVVTFCMHLLQVPYSSLIVARERMSIFAVFSIFDVVLKLVIVFMLSISLDIDKLILYGLLMMGVSMVMTLCYHVYCNIWLRADSKVTGYWDKNQFKDIFSFASWNLVGGVTSVGATEIPNYFMNFYLGVAVNAAMGVAKQVSHAIYSFSANFQTAFNPQIIKAYAAKENDYLLALVYRTSKLSFYLLYIIAVPFLLCSNEVLNIWLTVVPEYTAVFCLCIVLAELVNATSSPLWMTIFAVGDIKKYQLWLCGINLSLIPVSWLVLAMGYAPYWILVYKAIASIIILSYRVCFLGKKIGFPQRKYYTNIILRLFLYMPIFTLPEIYWISTLFEGWGKICATTVASIVIITLVFYLFALERGERQIVVDIVKQKIRVRGNI